MKGFIELIIVLILGWIVMTLGNALGGFVLLVLGGLYMLGVLFWLSGKANK